MEDSRFWLLTFPAPAGPPDCQLVTAAGSALDVPLAAIKAVAVEIFQSDMAWTILVSIADSPESPTTLQCLFGVSNAPSECDRLARFGFPMIDGEIGFVDEGGTGLDRLDQTALRVSTVVYGLRTEGEASTPRSARLMQVSGIDWDAPPQGVAATTFDPHYESLQTTPDLARPDIEMVGRTLDITPHRSDVRRADKQAQYVVCNKELLYPDLFKLFESTRPASALWVGSVGELHPTEYPNGLRRMPRSSVFGAPSFKFDDVEIIGFRIELQSAGRGVKDAALGKLTRLLNFHHPIGSHRPADFRYQAATATVIIELLRYGKMRAVNPPPPFSPDDFMSQHELLARVLVGRVDDDTSQARDAAIFVPTIFVDNPWSKALGRRLQGFPKRLAEFRAGADPLAMDGRKKVKDVKSEDAPVPLHHVTEVHLVRRLGGNEPLYDKILTLECPDDSADQFRPADVPSILSGTLFRRAPWEQFDFEDTEFRRSFARDVVADQFTCFRSVQVSPFDPIGLPKAWITGRVDLKNVEVAFPTGIATLTLESPASSPQAWKDLHGALLEKSESISFPTGDWYRLKCSMELEIDDGLSW